MTHWPSLNQIARARLPPGDPTRLHLQNNAILQACSDLLQVFDPVAIALDAMQKSTCTLAEAVEIWLRLIQKVPKNAGGHNLVVERSKQALECPFFLLANVLDHRFSGRSLAPSQISSAREYVGLLGPEVATAFTSYLARTSPFSEAMFAETGEPTPWWQAGRLSGFPPDLVAIALRLCACLSSSATLERNFSTMGNKPQTVFF